MIGKNSSARHSTATMKDFSSPGMTPAVLLVPWHNAQQSLAGASVVNSFGEMLVGLKRYCSFKKLIIMLLNNCCCTSAFGACEGKSLSRMPL